MTIHNRTFCFLDFIIAVVVVMLVYMTVVFADEGDMSVANTIRNHETEKGRALASKLGLLDRLVNDSPAAKRISASTNFGAKQSLQDASEALTEALIRRAGILQLPERPPDERPEARIVESDP